MRKRNFIYNTISAVVKQLVYLICGFVLPKYILLYFGSSANGLVSSITQFLGFITFLEMGIGSVIQYNLYKPLAKRNINDISKIVISSEKFFKKISYIFIIYILVLIIIFPSFTGGNFDYMYTSSLILIISISIFTQYYFGITYQLVLNADQKSYIQISLQTITIILNTLVSVFLMKVGCSIHIVKLSTSIIYLLRPIGQAIYVNKHYNINRKVTYTNEPIKQKWNGFAQHLAGVIVANTDVTILTICSNLSNVSIYSVYYTVVYGINNTIMTLVTGLESLWGNMIANNEIKKLNQTFEYVEWIMHMGCTLIFSITGVLIIPFIRIYTKGINDANYIIPTFGIILVAAYAVQCLRVPYFRVIKAAGHYKQTQMGSIIQMIINIVLSVLLVSKFGINGVAVGTFVAMFYHTTYFAWYLRKNILQRNFLYYLKYIFIDIIIAGVCYKLTGILDLNVVTYFEFIMLALRVSIYCCIVTILISTIFYKNIVINIFNFKKIKYEEIST